MVRRTAQYQSRNDRVALCELSVLSTIRLTTVSPHPGGPLDRVLVGTSPPQRPQSPPPFSGGTLRITRKAAFAAVAATSVLALAACSSGGGGSDDETDDAGINTETSINIAWNQPFYSANGTSITGNATANNIITVPAQLGVQLLRPGPEPGPERRRSAPTRRSSDDPLTVKYTLADDAKWSDGTPGRTAADLLLEWAAQSGKFNNVEAEYDDDGRRSRTRTRWTPVSTSTPPTPAVRARRGDAGDRRQQVDHADLHQAVRGLGDAIDRRTCRRTSSRSAPSASRTPQEATDALVTAIQDNDGRGPLEDRQVVEHRLRTTRRCRPTRTSSSPAARTTSRSSSENQFITLTRERRTTRATTRPSSTRSRSAGTTTRWARSRRCRTVRSTSSTRRPRPTFKTAVEAHGRRRGRERARGHLRARRPAVQQRWPVRPGDLRRRRGEGQEGAPGVPHDDPASADHREPDQAAQPGRRGPQLVHAGPRLAELRRHRRGERLRPRRTRRTSPAPPQLLAEAGVAAPCRSACSSTRTTRAVQNEFELIKASAAQAGFDVAAPTRSRPTGARTSRTRTSFYDAALFGWQSTSTAVTELRRERTAPVATNNYYGYSNAEVDALFDELQVDHGPGGPGAHPDRDRDASSSTTRSASRSSSSPASPPGTRRRSATSRS